MASLVARAATRDIRTVIVPKDKDLLQVVDARTSVWNPSKEMTIDTANVKEVFGAEAGAVVDVLALWGDPTDNVPGALPIELALDRYTVQEPDEKETIRLFGELEFSSLLPEFLKAPRPAAKSFRTICDEAELRALAARIAEAGEGALDTETDSPAPTRARLVGLSFSLVPGGGYSVPLR